MVVIYYKQNLHLKKEVDLEKLTTIDPASLIWVDLNYSAPSEVETVENLFGIEFQTRQQSEEIEMSSRFIEFNKIIIANIKFIKLDSSLIENVSFLLKDNTLFTYRTADLKSFAESVKKMKINPQLFHTGYDVFLTLLESKIDNDADLIEELAKEISELSRYLSIKNNIDENVLLKITSYQEKTMLLRENIIDKQRIVSAFLKSEMLPKNIKEKLRIFIKDINSILEHCTFGFERLEYLQNTFLGLINIEQNKTIKIFTVVSVIFLPPTLIASIYGMNFKILPELNWDFGYPFAIFLMIASSFVTLFLFKRNKWL